MATSALKVICWWQFNKVSHLDSIHFPSPRCTLFIAQLVINTSFVPGGERTSGDSARRTVRMDEGRHGLLENSKRLIIALISKISFLGLITELLLTNPLQRDVICDLSWREQYYFTAKPCHIKNNNIHRRQTAPNLRNSRDKNSIWN